MPPQHGAWGFLALPLVLGIAAAGWSFWLIPLAIAWVAAYPTSWALTGLLTARRPERFRRAAVIWLPICVVAGVPVLITHPWLGWLLAVYLLLFLVNVQQAKARRERSMFNDLVLIVECALLVPIVAGVVGGGFPPEQMAVVLTAMTACALTLVGSTLHVKSLIRERANPVFTYVSQAFAVACVPVMAVTSWLAGQSLWLAVPFGLLAVRAWWWHRPDWRPVLIGMGELAGLLVVAGPAIFLL
ncbi:YwiC-like family protein [Kineosporia babensis]|uniref:YwiC-like family protein n=1 Tax=Kineosporia babensis TaxID=499548 RepID=A0A9X1NLW4_9ACTN|nr:YwiC-like family protein [Kineosporia babensis]